MKLRLYYSDWGNHPVLGQVYIQRQEILDGDEKARYQRYIANCLGGLAPSIEDCDRILAVVEDVEAGRRTEVEIEGNDIDVALSVGAVQVNINVNDDWVGQSEGRFSLKEFKTAIGAWREFLNMPESLNSELFVEL